ncbi:VOC family protein [Egicoccus sp. AB-alg2]|uniref:VOC family protein n=1 Tax=Egicoccus sp. AB-alg2 TaxID=3242693 RepID=UPI00359D469D
MDGKLQVELFVDDVERSVGFYCRVLDFERVAKDGASRDYVAVRRGDAVIGIGRAGMLPDDHPAARVEGQAPGRGVELVLEVDDVEAACEHAQAAGATLATGLGDQPWGRRDFRLLDPDGYYVRVTSP